MKNASRRSIFDGCFVFSVFPNSSSNPKGRFDQGRSSRVPHLKCFWKHKSITFCNMDGWHPATSMSSLLHIGWIIFCNMDGITSYLAKNKENNFRAALKAACKRTAAGLGGFRPSGRSHKKKRRSNEQAVGCPQSTPKRPPWYSLSSFSKKKTKNRGRSDIPEFHDIRKKTGHSEMSVVPRSSWKSWSPKKQHIQKHGVTWKFWKIMKSGKKQDIWKLRPHIRRLGRTFVVIWQRRS